MLKHKRMEEFLLNQCFTLYYFGKAVVQHEVYFNRYKFSRIPDYLNKYCLFNYRLLKLKHPPMIPKLFITKRTTHLNILTFFYTIFTFKCLVVMLISQATSTLESRILLGIELWKEAAPFIETTLGLWSIICFCYLHFNLTSNLLDYKFLAVIMLNNAKHSWLYFKNFGLTKVSFRQLDNFRRAIMFNYLSQISLTPFFNFFGIIFILVKTNLVCTNPVTSLFWLFAFQFDAIHGVASKFFPYYLAFSINTKFFLIYSFFQ